MWRTRSRRGSSTTRKGGGGGNDRSSPRMAVHRLVHVRAPVPRRCFCHGVCVCVCVCVCCMCTRACREGRRCDFSSFRLTLSCFCPSITIPVIFYHHARTYPLRAHTHTHAHALTHTGSRRSGAGALGALQARRLDNSAEDACLHGQGLVLLADVAGVSGRCTLDDGFVTENNRLALPSAHISRKCSKPVRTLTRLRLPAITAFLRWCTCQCPWSRKDLQGRGGSSSAGESSRLCLLKSCTQHFPTRFYYTKNAKKFTQKPRPGTRRQRPCPSASCTRW